ncbi:hypothetical protein M378DRAFT_154770 [Amanita muscaria Koide BX008]|uniref:Uncharacterized protein n=1 Tax=Amanita muscaria (strain Koide BX008) TaxID=946122 RepID=A0A0C2T5N9_AMAMK|nr:hypothetical protein M378DRAFT_154770 [Amanita muscaria Koide BX008]
MIRWRSILENQFNGMGERTTAQFEKARHVWHVKVRCDSPPMGDKPYPDASGRAQRKQPTINAIIRAQKDGR